MKVLVLVVAIAVIVGANLDYARSSEIKRHSPEAFQPITVAFIGDQGSNENSRAVLRLIKAEGADLVLHQGDLYYRNDPDSWDNMITKALGVDFPYFAAIGNHDLGSWSGPNGYQAKLRARLRRISGARCDGEIGVKIACSYGGLFFIQSGIGTEPEEPDNPGHVAFIRKQLAQTDAIWRVCSWHKNQSAMQVGKKHDEVGWGAYEACRKGGAIVATGHSHTYSRTHLMNDFETQDIASTSRTLEIAEGKSFAFVSGLGGASIRSQYEYEHGYEPWWAAIYTSTQEANFGVLFCTFFVDGIPNRARCYFKDIAGNVPDRFELINNNPRR